MTEHKADVDVHAIIPAEPGWSVAEFLPGPGTEKGQFEYDRVVAWHVRVYEDHGAMNRSTMPVGLLGQCLMMGPWALVSPGGKLFVTNDDSLFDAIEFDSVAEALSNVEIRYAEWQKEMAAARERRALANARR
jgi:hypothetical protein